MKVKFVILFLFSLFLFACSSSQETAKDEEEKEEPEIYIFDDVTDVEDDSVETVEEEIEFSEPVQNQEIKYYVQVGAFTTRDRAESFVNENMNKISYPMDISYSEDVQLYVVQLPPFNTRAEAENVRNELWKMETFNDAFILTK